MPFEQIRRFVSLDERKRELDAELNAVKQELTEAKPAAIEELVTAGLEAVVVDGRRVKLQQKASASPANDREEVIDALRASDLGQYVTENYNTNSLASLVEEVRKELADRAKKERWERPFTEDDVRAALLESLGQALKISFYYTLSNTKA